MGDNAATGDAASPAFLMSMPRSGSTMLSMMLGAHSAIDCPPEPWLMLVAAQYFRHPLGPRGPYGREQAELATIEFALGLETDQAGALAEVAQSALTSRSMLKRLLPAGKSQMMEALVKTVYRNRLAARGRQVFVDKTPRYYIITPLLDAVFAKPKMIVLQRHPLDILASYKAIGWGSVSEILNAETPNVFTRDFCEGLFALEALRHRSKKNTRVLRYEALAVAPQEELSGICDLLGLRYEESMVDYINNAELLREHRESFFGDPNISLKPQPANPRGVGRWQERLSPPEIAAAIAFLGVEIFERLGYPETIERLNELGIVSSGEAAAGDLRARAMENLRALPVEPPLSIWRAFYPAVAERDALQKDNYDRGQQIDSLRALIEESEADRAARGKQIEVLTNLLREH